MAPTKPGGITAPPNRCDLKGKLVSIAPSPRFPDKQELTFELLASCAREGPDMAHPRIGTTVTGFSFETPADLGPNDVFSAQAEYIGDARRGQFQLFQLRRLDA